MWLSCFSNFAEHELKDLRSIQWQSTVQTHTVRLAVFVLQEPQRPIRLRDGCDEFVKKNKMIDTTLAVSKHGWGFHSSAVIDKALSENVSTSADLPVDKDAAWDWDWSIPKLPTRRGYDSSTLFCQVKKSTPHLDTLSTFYLHHKPAPSQDTEVGREKKWHIYPGVSKLSQQSFDHPLFLFWTETRK